MADSEHADMHSMEPPDVYPVLDGAGLQAQFCELPPRHDAVLSGRQHGKLMITWAM